MYLTYVNTFMKLKTKRATGVIEVIAIVAIIGLGIAWFKPTKEKSVAKEVDKVTTQVQATDNAIDEKVSASVNQIGVANSMAPESPSKTFISREVQLITPFLPTPNMNDLLEAERRRVAVMEGKVEEANRLYKDTRKENDELLKANVKANEELKNLKQELYEQAAVAEFLKKVTIIVGLILGLLTAAYIWLKLTFNKTFGGLREFVTYTKDESTLGQLREALDSEVKKKLGL